MCSYGPTRNDENGTEEDEVLGFKHCLMAVAARLRFIMMVINLAFNWSSAVGLFLACSRIGSVIAPLILILEDTWHNLPAIIFGSLSITAGIFALFLIETKGSQLPSTLWDMNNLYSKKTVGEDADIKEDYTPHKKEMVSAENPSFEHA